MKRKIYIAKRIAQNQFTDAIIDVNKSMSVSELKSAYADKIVDRGGYIHNGHWIMRSISTENEFSPNNFPSDLRPCDVIEMVENKIRTSDAIVAIISGKSYGAIAEIGLAVGLKKALYVLPEPNLKNDEIEDLWLSFNISLLSRSYWLESDIVSVSEFKERGIDSLESYLLYINKIVPPFLK